MVGFIRGLSYLISFVYFFAGIALAFQVGYLSNVVVGLIVLALALLIAFASHWLIKLAYVGLEILADISEDLRAIRLSRSI